MKSIHLYHYLRYFDCPTDCISKTEFSKQVILVTLCLPSVRLPVKEASILRSFGKAHQRRVHVSIHTNTRRHTAAHREHHPTKGATPHPEYTVLGFVTFDSRPSQTCHDESGRAVWILRPAPTSTVHRQKDPLPDRVASSSKPAGERMSRTPEDSRSKGGGSDSDLKMASSSNTSPEGGPPHPLHQNRLRQVGVCPHWLARSAR